MSRRCAVSVRRLTQRVRRQSDCGSSTIQMVVLMPALFTLMFLGVQAALLYQGRAIALAAAQEGARDIAGENGSTQKGIATATGFVATSTAGLKSTSVTGYRTPTTAGVTVTTHTVSVIPGWSPRIVQSASMPVEKVTG